MKKFYKVITMVLMFMMVMGALSIQGYSTPKKTKKVAYKLVSTAVSVYHFEPVTKYFAKTYTPDGSKKKYPIVWQKFNSNKVGDFIVLGVAKGINVNFRCDISVWEVHFKEPRIGMNRNEAIKSAWGDPIDSNVTVTEYGENEQLVFEGDRYIYLDNGIVTAIQK